MRNLTYLSICQYMMKDDKQMDLLTLMKLVYIAHGYLLAVQGKNQYVPKDSFEAWEYGPVLPVLYYCYKQCHETFGESVESARCVRKEDEKVLGVVLKRYGKIHGFGLVEMTHRNGTPWSAAFQPLQRHIVIPDVAIKDYYTMLIREVYS